MTWTEPMNIGGNIVPVVRSVRVHTGSSATTREESLAARIEATLESIGCTSLSRQTASTARKETVTRETPATTSDRMTKAMGAAAVALVLILTAAVTILTIQYNKKN